MNYTRIHNQLIDRSRNRVVIGYTEKHHIIPRCMGSSDDPDNIAILHYVAHQLLVKIYPDNTKLTFAVIRMSGKYYEYKNNKLYRWIRKKFASEISALQKDRPKSEEHKRKIGEANRGRKQTPEHIQKRIMSYKRSHQLFETPEEVDARWKKFWEDRKKQKENAVITALIYSVL